LPPRIKIQGNHRVTESQRGDHREEITERRSQRRGCREEDSEEGGFEHV
jgi:hypothetical protein